MLLQFKNISIGYQYPLIEIPLNLSFYSSTFNVLFGNNGCGKTSLIKTIARLLTPLCGEIIYNQQNIFEMNNTAFSKSFSFLFTTKPFLMNHTVFDVIALGRTPYLNWNGKLSSADKEIIMHYAELFDIQDILYLPANHISDGQLQKTLIAKTLSQQCSVIILDEALSFLDYSTKKTILKTLKDIAKSENKIILMSSHDIHLCEEYADNVLLIHQKKWAYNSADKIYSEKIFNMFLNTEG